MTLTEDSPLTMPSGATFRAPAGWAIEQRQNAFLFKSNEGDVEIAVTESSFEDSDQAVADAWPLIVPCFRRTVKICQTTPARNGWDEVKNYGYENSPNEKLMIASMAYRKGNVWSVVLFYGDEAGFERRQAQIRLIGNSLRPKNYVRESFAGRRAHELTAARVGRLLEFLERARDLGKIPGIAVGLVQNEKVVFQGGLGVRELGTNAPVDAETRFLIASNTKQLTTLLLAKLVDQGKFDWDTPVTSVFPQFRLADEEATRRMQMRHLVSACTGLPRKDLEWLMNFKNSNAQTIFELLAEMKPTSGFGEVFQYSNVLGAAAGFIAGHCFCPGKDLGRAYEEAMQALIFEPLGMCSSSFDYSRSLQSNHASPHSEDVDGQVDVASMDINYAAIPMAPALGLWTNVSDLLRYVQMELAKGRLSSGARYISEEALFERRRPGVVFEEDAAYGMGLVIKEKAGVKVIDHGGALIGFKSNIFWLPEHAVGGVLLTNADNGNILVQTFVRKLLEILFDGSPEADEDMAMATRLRREQIAAHRAQLRLPPEESAVAGLARLYGNPILGHLQVRQLDGETIFDFGEWKSRVASRSNEDGSTSFFTVDPGVGTFEFVLSQHDGRRALLIRDKQHEYAFEEAD